MRIIKTKYLFWNNRPNTVHSLFIHIFRLLLLFFLGTDSMGMEFYFQEFLWHSQNEHNHEISTHILTLSLSHSLRNENLFMGFWENSWCLGHLFSLGNNLLTQIKKHTQLNSVLRTYFGCCCCFCLISSIFDKKNIRIVLREVNNESHVLRLVLSAYFSKHITHRRKKKKNSINVM